MHGHTNVKKNNTNKFTFCPHSLNMHFV